MSIISTAQHNDFCNRMREQIEEWKLMNRKAADLQPFYKDIELMEELFTRYQEQLRDIRVLIEQYDSIKKRARIRLRKAQTEQKKQVYG
jgi:hypothetical protein